MRKVGWYWVKLKIGGWLIFRWNGETWDTFGPPLKFCMIEEVDERCIERQK